MSSRTARVLSHLGPYRIRDKTTALSHEEDKTGTQTNNPEFQADRLAQPTPTSTCT
jgi:hypothetical protein